MKNFKSPSWLHHGLGVVVVLVGLIAANAVLRKTDTQYDLTASGEYTLSEGSKAILAQLQEPVTLRYYVSERGNQLPLNFRNHSFRVENLLNQFVRHGGGKFNVVKHDPEPDSDAELSAVADGLQPINLDMFSQVYFGISVNCMDRSKSIPVLSPSRSSLLEYDISQAIASVRHPKKPVVGIYTTHPIYGRRDGKEAGRPGGGEAPRKISTHLDFPPWFFLKQIQEQFEVRDLRDADPEKLPEDLALLMVMTHREVPRPWEEAMDRHLGAGGKLLLLMDPLSLVPLMTNHETAVNVSTSNDKPFPARLLSAWGLKYRPDGVLGDMGFRAEVDYGNGAEVYHTVLEVIEAGIDTEDAITASIRLLGIPYAGGIDDVKPVDGLEKTSLVHSTEASEIVSAQRVIPNDRASALSLLNQFQPSGRRWSIVTKLTGRFPSAFEAEGDQTGSRDNQAAAVVITDTDFIFDPSAVGVDGASAQQTLIPINDNLALLMNSVEFLMGDQKLVSVRQSRRARRPLTYFLQLRSEAEESVQQYIGELEERMQALNHSDRDGGEEPVVVMEERKALEKEMRRARRELRQKVAAIESRLLWLNVLTVPVIIAAVGLGVAWWRRRRGSRNHPPAAPAAPAASATPEPHAA